MAKTKIIAIVASAALVAVLGLSACGSQASSGAASNSSAAPTSASAAPAAPADSSAPTSAPAASDSSAAPASAPAASAEAIIVSWQGALADGTLVDYISSDDGKNGGFVLTKDDTTEPKRWLGAQTVSEDGKITITDDTSKESVSFTLVAIIDDGTAAIEVEGYGKGALVPMTAADWQRVAEVEELGKTLGTVVNTIGILEDGSTIVYVESADTTKAVVGLMPKGSDEMKVWAGEATTADDGKETVTDEKSGETFSYYWTENAEDGTMNIDTDAYGKGVLVKMTVADWLILDELLEQVAKL